MTIAHQQNARTLFFGHFGDRLCDQCRGVTREVKSDCIALFGRFGSDRKSSILICSRRLAVAANDQTEGRNIEIDITHGVKRVGAARIEQVLRSEEHTSELQSLMRISYAVFCLKKKKIKKHNITDKNID